jgi:hypothetical protein
MTAYWTPTTVDLVSPTAMTPVLGPLVDGDLCDIRVGRGYCGEPAERAVQDVDGRERLLCRACLRLYFPAELAVCFAA